jgi:hypothetical protein
VSIAEVRVALEGPVAGLVGYHRLFEWAEAAPVRYVITPPYEADAACKGEFCGQRIAHQQIVASLTSEFRCHGSK